MAHDFIYSANPSSIALSGAQRFLSSFGWDTQVLANSGSLLLATTPSATTYSGWVTSGTEFVAEDGQLVRYIGSIWERKTRFIKAQ